MTISLSFYKQLRNNKDLIVKNYHYRRYIGFTKYQNDFKNKSKNIETIAKINRDSSINADNINIYKHIILIVNKLNITHINALICYTPKLENINNDKRNNLFELYETIYKTINKTISHNDDFQKLLVEIALHNVSPCKEFKSISIPMKKFRKKIQQRAINYGKYDKTWHYIIYNDIIYYLTIDTKKPKTNINLCINGTFTIKEAEWLMDFAEHDYSPIFNAMENPKNLPEPTYITEPLSRRKSISKLSGINYDKNPKKLGTYTPKEYFDSKNPYTPGSVNFNKREKHLEFKIREVMQCFRNDRDNNGKLLFGPVEANERREPFIKQVLNFPPIYNHKKGNKGGKINKCDLKLLEKIRFELNNILALIKLKYPPKQDKEFFLLDLAGGAGKHFDYSLYSFTKEELKQPQNTFLVKKNLWKKLEFKTNQNAKNINGLSNYLQKAPQPLFDTVNKTFANEFIKMTQNIVLHKKWLRKNINNNEYFTRAIENILQGQKNKIYIIWNVEDEKIYLDNFLDNELKINHDENNKPQIYLDEELLNKGFVRIIIKTGESEHWIDYVKSKKNKKQETDEEDEEEDVDDDSKNVSGNFKFQLKRNIIAFFDKKFQKKLQKLNIDTSSFETSN
jgi:hypothetical protein